MLPPHLHIFLHYLGIGTGFESFDNILASFYYRSHKTAFIDRKHLLEIGNHGLQFRLGVGSLAIFHKLRRRAGMERYMIGIGIKLGALDEQELLQYASSAVSCYEKCGEFERTTLKRVLCANRV